MKKCPNNHDNPDNAKFCRICGCQFDVNVVSRVNKAVGKRGDDSFTLDVFSNIDLLPRSIVNVNFGIASSVVISITALLFFALLFIAYFASSEMGVLLLLIIVGLFLPIFFSLTLDRLRKRKIFNDNADYIETSPFMLNIYRIAKEGKLGLFDKSEKLVLLLSQYDDIATFYWKYVILVEANECKGLFSLKGNSFIIPLNLEYDSITKFDDELILVQKKGMKGLFSLNRMKVIIPLDFDHIEPFKNSILKCYKGAKAFYYDINGNKLK